MKRHITILLLLFFPFTLSLSAQSLVSTSGGSVSNTRYQFEYALGEIAIATIPGSSSIATQGLLQPQVKIINPDCEIINLELKTFENPTRGIARIVGVHDWITFYLVYAADGKLLRSEPFVNNYINLSNLPAATYFVKLLPGCNGKFKVLKIVKQ